MRFPLLFLICLLSLSGFSQEEKVLEGKVVGNKVPLEDVHVRNVSEGIFTITTGDGRFQLKAEVGDTLVLSHVAHRDLIHFISEEDFRKDYLELRMINISNELDEVIVDENNGINAVSLGIIPKKIEKLSVNERRLRTAGDFKPVHLLSILGGGLNIDAVLNAINGRTKKLKKNIDVEQEIKFRNYLEVNYTEFIQENCQPTVQEYQLFLDVLLEKEELQHLIVSKDHEGLKFLILETWFDFKKK